jgi:hypothetical protein
VQRIGFSILKISYFLKNCFRVKIVIKSKSITTIIKIARGLTAIYILRIKEG